MTKITKNRKNIDLLFFTYHECACNEYERETWKENNEKGDEFKSS